MHPDTVIVSVTAATTRRIALASFVLFMVILSMPQMRPVRSNMRRITTNKPNPPLG